MAITRLGFGGPSAAYPGFSPKTESAALVSTLDHDGEYIAAIEHDGEYVTAIEHDGEVE